MPARVEILLALAAVVMLILLAVGWLSPAGFCLLGVLGMLLALYRGVYPPEVVLTATLGVFLIGDSVVPVEQSFLSVGAAFSGFANPAVVTVALLFIVASAVRNTGVLDRVATLALGSQSTERGALMRLSLPVVGMSAFLNNTPIVAIFMPLLRDWAVRQRLAPSRLLLPLSYLTILGGMCTLVGTSTNLVVSGLMGRAGIGELGLFELGAVGLPCAIVGAAYLYFAAPRLLPANTDMLGDPDAEVREYLVEMVIETGSRLHDRSIEDAGLRAVDGAFLFQVRRGDETFAPVKREFVLEEGDVLVFSGARDRLLALPRIAGLSMPRHCEHMTVGDHSQLIEVVVSRTSPLLGQTLREVRFNRKYDAAVLAIHRSGERIESHLAETPLQAGDTLLLIAGIGFRRIWQQSPDFYLVSPLRRDLGAPGKGLVCLAIVVAMIVLPMTGGPALPVTALVAVVALVFSRCLRPTNILRLVEWDVIAVIAAAFGLSAAMAGSGAATWVASQINTLGGFGPIALLAAVYLMTNVLTELITNNAAAALMFPIALQTAERADADPRAFAVAVAIAASASFATPIGYQTNMMVYGPGGYHYRDYLRLGLPLNLLCCLVALLLIPHIWPL